MRRVLTGLLLALGAGALIFMAPGWVFLPLIAILSALALREFFRLADKAGLRAYPVAGQVSALLWIVLPNLDRGHFGTVIAIVLLAAGILGRLPLTEVLPAAAVTVSGLLYVAGPMLAGVLLHGVSPHWLFLPLLVAAIGDIAAFLVGRSLGRHPLSPRVSPRKTWEGTLASVVAGTLAGTLYGLEFLAADLNVVQAVILGAVLNVFGQLGDLSESALKRAAGAKDSGRLLPGHGGILDRVDAMLFTVPVAYGYVQLFL